MLLPVGYRFDPTDEELVIHYLRRKVHGLPLPASIIPDYNNYYFHHPSNVPMPMPLGETLQKRYFFSKRDNNKSNNTRAADGGCGFWRSIGKEKQIVATTSCDQSQVLGVRKTFVLCSGQQKKKKKTKHHHQYHYQHQCGSLGTSPRWLMHEYHLLGSEVSQNSWVLCSVFQKRRKPTSKKTSSTLHINIEESGGHLPKPSDSCSSEVISTDDQDVLSKCY